MIRIDHQPENDQVIMDIGFAEPFGVPSDHKKIKIEQMKKLTHAEEEIMRILWDLKSGFVKDVIEKMGDPKPPYNTVSTVIRVLEKKGFISHRQYGNTYEYFPTIAKEDYAKVHFQEFITHYFNNSFPRMAAFFARENNLSIKDLEEIIKPTEVELKKESKSDHP